MKVQDRLSLLKKIYEIHDEYTSKVQTACAKGCAACCTCNVTVVTMEGLWIYNHLKASGRSEQVTSILRSMPPLRYRPRMTLNRMVEHYAAGRQPPEEENDPSAGICPLLEDGVCSIYPVRPFGCRAMLSSSDCSLAGEAEMPPMILSVNHVILQYIEAVDRPGGTGNLLDVLDSMTQDAARKDYLNGKGPDSSARLPANRSIPVLMVPPVHRRAIGPLVQSLNTAIRAFQ